MFGLSNGFIYIIAIVLVVALVGGFYTFMNHRISTLEATIENQRAEIAAKQLDINNLKLSNSSLEQLLATRRAELEKANSRLKRITDVDSTFNQSVAALETFLRDPRNSLLASRNSTLLEKLTLYQICRIQSPMEALKCIDILISP